MKRIVSLLLCLVMIVSAVGILSSCSKGGGTEPKVDKKIAEVDLTGYSIVTSSELTNVALGQVNNMSATLRTLTGANVRVQRDVESEEVETEDLEILVGQTMRTETTKTLSGIKDHGWAIRVFDNKIVIVGTTPFLTAVALSYFVEHYVQDAAIEKTVMSVNQKVVLSKMEMITTLADEEGNSLYSVVYDDSVDDTVETQEYATNSNPTGGMSTDEIYNIAASVQGDLRKAIGAKVLYKKASVEKSDYEVLVGNMEREEYRAELETLNVKEYAVAVRNGKIMLLAWNEATLPAAYALFQDMFKGSVITDDEGNDSYAIPANCFVKESVSNNWFIDFPKPEGADIRLEGTVDVNDNSIEYIYSGEGVNDASFEAYCDTLEDAGYTLYGTETVWGESSFRQYVDADDNISLYVYHSAYQYAAEQKITDVLPSIRIISTNLENNESSLPGKEILTEGAWTKITDSMITSLKHDYKNTPDPENLYSWGLSYVITLEDGSFVIFDGGIGRGYTDDCSYLWSVLNNLYKKTRAAANLPTVPSSSDPIRVRAWVLTHEHSDHFTVFKKFLQTYGKQNFKMDYLVFNAISASERINSNNPETAVQTNFSTMKEWVNGGFNYIKAHTGQVFYFANLKMEVLYTHEDLYPKHVEYFNNSGTVVRTTITSGSRESTCIWLGDMERNGSRRLRAMYGPTLDSEMVQVAHHGGNGCEAALYELIQAEVVWFPSDSGRFNSQGAPAQAPGGAWYNKASWTACNSASAEIVIMSDKATQTMYITEAGREADYKNMFDAKTGLPIPEETFQNNLNGIIDQRD